MFSDKCPQNTYNLLTKAKCLSNTHGSILTDKYNLHYFLISSNVPFVDNTVHLIEYNDQNCYVRNVNVFKAEGEIKQMACLGSFADNQRKNVLLLCTTGNNTNVLNGTYENFNQKVRENKCFIWTGQPNNLEEITDADIDTDTESDNETSHEIKISKNEEKREESREQEVKVKGKTEKKNSDNKKEQILEKISELNSGKDYRDIKKIETDSYEKIISKIVIIDQCSYNLFEMKQQNIHFIQSNEVNVDLNYGVLDPHHSNIITLISDSNIYGYDLKSNENIFSTFANHKSKLSAIDFNPNIPNIIATSSHDGYIKLWDLRFFKDSFFSINTHSHWVTSVNFNNFHDELLLTTSTDFSVKLHKIEYNKNFNIEDKKTNYKLIKTYRDHEESVLQGVWSNTDAWVFASISYDGKCVINTVPEEQKYKILL